MTKLITGMVVAVGLACTLSADGAAAYKKCAACHGANGEKAALGKSKVINQMTKAEIVTALNGYNLSETDIQAIAEMIGK